MPLYFLTHPPPPEIYTLSLHDALPISADRFEAESRAFHEALRDAYRQLALDEPNRCVVIDATQPKPAVAEDRKSTRLNSSHLGISYAVFCLKKKKEHQYIAYAYASERS